MIKCTSVYIKFITTTATGVPTSPAEVEILLLSLPLWSHVHFPAFWLVTHRLLLTTSHMISINNSDGLIPIPHCYFCIIWWTCHIKAKEAILNKNVSVNVHPHKFVFDHLREFCHKTPLKWSKTNLWGWTLTDTFLEWAVMEDLSIENNTN